MGAIYNSTILPLIAGFILIFNTYFLSKWSKKTRTIRDVGVGMNCDPQITQFHPKPVKM
jgi:hypothetical protein